MLIISRSIICFSRRDRWNRGALSAPYVQSQTTVTAVFYYYTAHIRRTASLHVIRLAQIGFVPPHMKGALVPLFHTCANFSKRCEWFLRASYQENNLQTPRIRSGAMKAVVIRPVNSLRTLYVDLKELIRLYIKHALVVENRGFKLRH